ncbi:hypothetical protein [Streptomyces mexicanus]|uniref:hypothetical protein n=1 Tax=Streptomyces mexicanus TaxID=178566 RepID=UPI00365A4BB4
MGAVLGDVLGFAAGVGVSPLPIIAVTLTLATSRGRLNGLLFTWAGSSDSRNWAR